jgi:hypothetical protein
MEEDMNYENYDDDQDQASDDNDKIFEAVMVFNSHFATYVKQTDPELFKRAVDYAKTFTEEDVSGIILNYKTEE